MYTEADPEMAVMLPNPLYQVSSRLSLPFYTGASVRSKSPMRLFVFAIFLNPFAAPFLAKDEDINAVG